MRLSRPELGSTSFFYIFIKKQEECDGEFLLLHAGMQGLILRQQNLDKTVCVREARRPCGGVTGDNTHSCGYDPE